MAQVRGLSGAQHKSGHCPCPLEQNGGDWLSRLQWQERSVSGCPMWLSMSMQDRILILGTYGYVRSLCQQHSCLLMWSHEGLG